MDRLVCLRGSVEEFLERSTCFLCVAGAFGGGVFGCRDSRLLRERHVAQAQEKGGLEAEEWKGMVRRS